MTSFDSPLRGRFGSLGVGALVILLLGTSAYSLAGLVRERRHVQDLTASNEVLIASLRQMQNQMQSVSEKLKAMAEQPAAIPPPAPRVAPREGERPPVRAAASPRKPARAADDPRWRQMQAKLGDKQKQIETTQKQIDTTREEASQARKELQDNLNSTRDELGGSNCQDPMTSWHCSRSAGSAITTSFRSTSPSSFTRRGHSASPCEG